MIASCKRRDDLLAEYITLTECSYMKQSERFIEVIKVDVLAYVSSFVSCAL